MKRWCENILTPINKLFTHYKKRRAHSQRRTMPMVPLVPSGRNAMEIGGSSRLGQRATGQAPCAPVHALAQAHSTWTWLRILQTPDSCRYCRAPLNLRGPLASLLSSITGSTSRLLGEVLSMPAGPLPMSYSQKEWLSPGQPQCQEWGGGQGTLQTHLGSGGLSQTFPAATGASCPSVTTPT